MPTRNMALNDDPEKHTGIVLVANYESMGEKGLIPGRDEPLLV